MTLLRQQFGKGEPPAQRMPFGMRAIPRGESGQEGVHMIDEKKSNIKYILIRFFCQW